MKMILCENYEEISKEAAKIVAKQLREKPDSVLGLATGSTPIGLYEELALMNKSGEVDFSKAQTFNLKETPLEDMLKGILKIPVKIDNDAGIIGAALLQ